MRNPLKFARKLSKKVGKTSGLLPTQRFVLLCHQRSGSNMFASMLDRHPAVDVFGQLYKNDPGFQEAVRRLGVPAFSGKLFDDQLASRERFDYLEGHPMEREYRNVKPFTETFFRQFDKSTLATRLGIKLHGGTLYQDEIRSIFFNGQYKVILQYRKNFLAAAVSWYQARELNQWMRRTHDQVEKQPLEMDIDTLAWFIENIKKDIAHWKNMLHAQSLTYLELTYEEITSPGFNFSRVWNFLEVTDIGSPPSGTKKLIKDYHHITNLAAIKEALASEENGFL